MCGHGAFIGREFDQNIFNLIMDANDNDGGHGAGMAYHHPQGWRMAKVCPSDGYKHVFSTRMVDELPEGKTLMDIIELHDIPCDVDLVMAHSRKATVGKISPSFVHPYVEKTDQGLIFVQHNGTVFNYKDLAESLGLGEVYGDTHAIVKAIALGREAEFFTNFTGQATVIWANSWEADSLYIFVGASKPNTADKSLFMWHHNGGTYISKLIAPLMSAKAMVKRKGKKLSAIRSVPVNTVLKLKGDELYGVYDVSRPSAKPAKPPRQEPISFKDRIDHSKLLSEALADIPVTDKLYYRAGSYYVNGLRPTTVRKLNSDTIQPYPRTFYDWSSGKLALLIDDATVMSASYKVLAEGSTKVAKFLENCEELFFISGLLCRNRASWEHLSAKPTLSVTMVQNHVLHPVLASHFDRSPSLSSIFLAPESPYKNPLTGVSSFGLMGPVMAPFSSEYYIFKASRVVAIQEEPSVSKSVNHWKALLDAHKPASLNDNIIKLTRVANWLLSKAQSPEEIEKLKKVKLILE